MERKFVQNRIGGSLFFVGAVLAATLCSGRMTSRLSATDWAPPKLDLAMGLFPDTLPPAPELDFLAADRPKESPKFSDESDHQDEPNEPGASKNRAEKDSVDSIEVEKLKFSLEKMGKELSDIKTDMKKKSDVADPNGKFTCKLGGMILMDGLFVDQSPESTALYGDVKNQFMLHDARLTAAGTGYGNLEYECTIGFNQGIRFKDVTLTAKKMPVVGDIKAGYFKVETGMNYVISIYDTTFSDFDTNTITYRLNRRLGVASTHYFNDKRVRLFGAIFTAQDFDYNTISTNGATIPCDAPGIILNARASVLPIWCENTDGDLVELLHFGSAFCWLDPKDPARLRSRPTGWFYEMPYLLQGQFDEAPYSIMQVEAAWQRRQLGIVSEIYLGSYKKNGNSYGASVMGRYALNKGGYQTYNKDRGCFAAMHVPENLRFIDIENHRCLAGPGLWEVTSIWSWTDMSNLRDHTATRYFGQMHEVASAVNWYWNSQTRLSLEWIHSMPTAATQNKNPKLAVCDTLLFQARFRF